MSFSNQDYQLMSKAIELAKAGLMTARPNPIVGCVIIQNGDIIGSGYHSKTGLAHAEINALNQAKNKIQHAELFVTLEPCCHHGHTKPCVDILIKTGFKRIIIGCQDPNPIVAGRGIAKLKQAKIDVQIGLLKEQCMELNRGYFKFYQTGLPFLTCKLGISLDGKVALNNGQSKWITSIQSRQDVQLLRAKHGAIITSANTILKDNPHLTIRITTHHASTVRIVLDPSNHLTNKNFNIFDQSAQTIIFNSDNTPITNNNQFNLPNILKILAKQKIFDILLEAGPNLSTAFLLDKLIDELVIYQSNSLLGANAMNMLNFTTEELNDKIKLNFKKITQINSDIKIIATPKY